YSLLTKIALTITGFRGRNSPDKCALRTPETQTERNSPHPGLLPSDGRGRIIVKSLSKAGSWKESPMAFAHWTHEPRRERRGRSPQGRLSLRAFGGNASWGEFPGQARELWIEGVFCEAWAV